MTTTPSASPCPFPIDDRGLISRAALLAAGFSNIQIQRAIKDGSLIRVWRGVYAPAGPAPRNNPDETTRLHRLRVLASQPKSTSTVDTGAAAVSHQSAALIWSLPLLRPNLRKVHVTSGTRTGGRIDNNRHIHTGLLTDSEVTVHDGVRVTTLERTAVDVACTSADFAQALAALDSALHLGGDRRLLDELLTARGKRQGARVARAAFQYAHPEVDNPGESWGRAQIIEAGLPVPDVQVKVFDDSGDLIGTCDVGWDDSLVGEFDGFDKYQRYLRPGENPMTTLAREKRREDAIRATGRDVVRWVWDDLVARRLPDMVAPRLRRLGIAS